MLYAGYFQVKAELSTTLSEMFKTVAILKTGNDCSWIDTQRLDRQTEKETEG